MTPLLRVSLWCNKDVDWGCGVIWGLTGEGSTSELILVGRIQVLVAAGLRTSVSFWLLAASCLQCLELPTVPGLVGFSTWLISRLKPTREIKTNQDRCYDLTFSCTHGPYIPSPLPYWLEVSHRSHHLQGEGITREDEHWEADIMGPLPLMAMYVLTCL